MTNVKISYTCLVVSHHWNHHRISSSSDYDTHLANLRNDSISYMPGLAVAKLLQFPWAQALPPALHWQQMTFINSGGAGGPLAIIGDGMLISISQPKSVMIIAGATCLSAAFQSIV